MAALTSDKKITIADSGIKTQDYKVKGAAVIYQGATVAVDAGGYLVPASNTAGLKVVGFALQACNATGAGDGVKSCQVGEARIFRANAAAGDAVTQAHIGKKVYVADDQTVRSTAGNAVVAGYCLAIEDGQVLVDVGVHSA